MIVDGDVLAPRLGWSAQGWLPGSDPASTKELLRSLGAWVRASGEGPVLIEDAGGALGDSPPGFGHEDGVTALHAVNIDQLGVLAMVHAVPGRAFTALRRRIVRSLADGAEVAIRRALAQEQLSRENAQLERRASTDPLTALSNRGGWDGIVDTAESDLRRGERVAVALFDLDGLKDVNDVHGHAAGDELLRSFARAARRRRALDRLRRADRGRRVRRPAARLRQLRRARLVRAGPGRGADAQRLRSRAQAPGLRGLRGRRPARQRQRGDRRGRPRPLRGQGRPGTVAATGASSKWVRRRKTSMRSAISGPLSRLTRSVPKSSTLNEAIADP